MREDEGLALLVESLDILRAVGDGFGVAQVLHTYGQALYIRGRREDMINAERMFRESLDLGETWGSRGHQARVLVSLSRVVGRYDKQEADSLMRRAQILDRSALQFRGDLLPDANPPKARTKRRQRKK